MVAWNGVVRAIHEYDQLGPEEFFSEHGWCIAVWLPPSSSRMFLRKVISTLRFRSDNYLTYA